MSIVGWLRATGRAATSQEIRFALSDTRKRFRLRQDLQELVDSGMIVVLPVLLGGYSRHQFLCWRYAAADRKDTHGVDDRRYRQIL